MLVYLCVILFILVFYLKLIKPLDYWTKLGVKQIKPWPLLGNFGIIRRKPFAEVLQFHYQNYPNERYCGIHQFIFPTLMIRDVELIKKIGVKEFDSFLNHASFIKEDVDPLWNKNLVASKDEKWRQLRSTLSPFFTSSKMRQMFILMEQCSRDFVQFFKDSTEEVIEIEAKDACSRYGNDVIATTAFGVTCNSLVNKDNEFYKAGIDLTNFRGLRGIGILLSSSFPALAKLLDIKIIKEKIGNFFREVIKDTIELRKTKNIIRPDMIQLLMEAQKDKLKQDEELQNVNEGFASVSESESNRRVVSLKPSMAIDDVTAHSLLFFFAGFDTVSTVMSFLLHELAVNPNMQERLFKEVIETLKMCNDTITYEALLKMKYLDMLVSETLRKWPPAAATDREVSKPFTIEPDKSHEHPLQLKVGDICTIPIYAIHRDPKYYENPEKFDPERFNDENKQNINQSAYLPFGIGPRNCIGSRFGLLEVKILFFHILTNFEIVPTGKTQIPLILDKQEVNLRAENGIWIGLKKRQ